MHGCYEADQWIGIALVASLFFVLGYYLCELKHMSRDYPPVEDDDHE